MDTKRVDLPCDCGCTVLSFEVFDPEVIYIDIYTHVSTKAKFSYKLKTAWALLRGKDHYLEGLVIGPGSAEKLKTFLNEVKP